MRLDIIFLMEEVETLRRILEDLEWKVDRLWYKHMTG